MSKVNGMAIPVVFTPDENFVVQTCVAIVSMLKSKKESTNYYFYIVVSSKINKERLTVFKRLTDKYEQFEYEIMYIDSEQFDELKITSSSHITESTYYRLGLADLLEDDRCMYHDGDILVMDDLSEMYHVAMDDCYVAGVKTIVQHQGSATDMKLIRDWNFPSMNQYIIAGDLTFNLKLIRERNINLSFYREMRRGYPQQDQDVLNFCCYDHIAFLPLRYGMLNRWVNNDAIYKFKNQIFCNAEIEEAKKHPAIVHFAGANAKPWVNLKVSYAEEWWRFAKEVLTAEEYQTWYNKALDKTQKYDLKTMINSIRERGKKVYLFGYTKIARELLCDLQLYDIGVEGFLDNDSQKIGDEYNGVKVLNFETVNIKDCLFVIASQRYANEIKQQLLSKNIPVDDIYIYIAKNDIYYQLLDNKYKEQEYRELMQLKYKICENGMDIEELKKMDSKNYWQRVYC